MTEYKTVKFNVGGTIHQVSRSLLDAHPHTLLATSASKTWQEDPGSEIFMERNGALFQYVLDYLRDGQVVLPITVSKEAVLQELQYYCVNVKDNESVSVTKCIQPVQAVNVVLSGMKRTYDKLEAVENELKKQTGYFSLSKMCIHEWMSEMQNRTELSITLDENQVGIPSSKLVEYVDDHTIMACNEHLNEVGLEISSVDWVDIHHHIAITIKTMRDIRKVVVSGAGCEAVNGVYIACGDSSIGIGAFVRKGEWEGEERTFELFCGKSTTSGNMTWFLRIFGEGDGKPQLNLYRARCATSDDTDITTSLSWKKQKNGIDPPPTVTPVREDEDIVEEVQDEVDSNEESEQDE